MEESLVIVGEIGGNDYNHALLDGKSMESVKNFVPQVVGEITSAINVINYATTYFTTSTHLGVLHKRKQNPVLIGMWSNENSKYCTNSKLWSVPLKNVNRSQKSINRKMSTEFQR